MEKSLIVMKFGGTSLGSPERIARAVDLVCECPKNNRVVVVVSAMAKVTDLLLRTMQSASLGETSQIDSNLTFLRTLHLDTAQTLLHGKSLKSVQNKTENLLETFTRTVRGIEMLREQPLRSVDEAVATGEKLCALLVSAAITAQGIEAEALNASELIVTDAVYGNASPLMQETTQKCSEEIAPLFRAETTAVITGFNGATTDGVPTTLGRGGSDFSASILASALDANELWIWTDVDGILTADPRLVSEAQLLSEVSYDEAAELAYNGAKVLHPRTLAPLAEKKIPVWIRNSFNPDKPGTRIVASITADHGVRAITSFPKVSLITIEAMSLSMSGAHLMSRALSAAALASVEVLLMTRSSFRKNFCMLVRSDEVNKALDSLQEELSLELEYGHIHPIAVDQSVGLLTAVGEGMRGTPGLAGDVFTALSRPKINIIAIAQGSSELTIAIVVASNDLDRAVQSLHKSCGLGRDNVETV